MEPNLNVHVFSGTVGGLLIVLLTELNSSDMVRTGVLTIISAIISFGVSMGLKYLFKYLKKH